MEISLFRQLCESSECDAECVKEKATKLGYAFTGYLDIPLIDLIGFEYPTKVYRV